MCSLCKEPGEKWTFRCISCPYGAYGLIGRHTITCYDIVVSYQEWQISSRCGRISRQPSWKHCNTPTTNSVTSRKWLHFSEPHFSNIFNGDAFSIGWLGNRLHKHVKCLAQRLEHTRPTMYLSLLIIATYYMQLSCGPSGITITIYKSKVKPQRLRILPNISQIVKHTVGFKIPI